MGKKDAAFSKGKNAKAKIQKQIQNSAKKMTLSEKVATYKKL